jgi:hypothetical protein
MKGSIDIAYVSFEKNMAHLINANKGVFGVNLGQTRSSAWTGWPVCGSRAHQAKDRGASGSMKPRRSSFHSRPKNGDATPE